MSILKRGKLKLSGSPPKNAAFTQLTDQAGEEHETELATAPETRTRGLMERSSLPADQGMLFLFEVAQPLSFWMFNTLIPLDIIFADAERRITSVYASVPPCRPPSRCSDGSACSPTRRPGRAAR